MKLRSVLPSTWYARASAPLLRATARLLESFGHVNLYEAAWVQDVARVGFILGRKLADAVESSYDDLRRLQLGKRVTDSISGAHAPPRLSLSARLTGQTVTLADNLRQTLGRRLTETVALTDLMQFLKSAKLFDGLTSPLDALTKASGKPLADSVSSLSDQILRYGYGRRLAESATYLLADDYLDSSYFQASPAASDALHWSGAKKLEDVSLFFDYATVKLN